MHSEATTNPASRAAAGPELAVEAVGLVKRYGDVVALDGLDLAVSRGSFFGLLGPNGAGKSTTVSILSTLTAPSAGQARLLGHDVVAERAAVRRDVGLVFQETTLDRELTAREQLDLHARLYHLDERPRRVREALAEVGLAKDADRPVGGFSGGMKRRLELARGLLHRPRVLFLDEPTLGLDVAARAAVWERLRALHASGEVTVFLTTHSMEEADALCEEIAIIDHGRLVTRGAPSALKAALGGDVVRIALARPDGAAAALACVAGVARVEREETDTEERLLVTVAEGPRRLAQLLEVARPFEVLEVELHRPSLEDVFLHHTGRPFEPRRSEAAA